MSSAKPALRPNIPFFSSGPCAKIPGWQPLELEGALVGRSHRSKPGKERLKRAIEQTRQILGVPASYKIGIVPASDTGAMECAMWSLLGSRPVDVLVWESFSEGWATDIVRHLKISDTRVLDAPYGALPDLAAVDFSRDVVFAWNGTTSGVRVPDADWIPHDRQGLTLCDATSAAFAQELDFDKLDVVTFSWQKALGGEGAHGILILSPRAVERLETCVPQWPLPKIFRLTSKGKLNAAIFEGETINTPSMLCVEDYLVALDWAEKLGGLKALCGRADANAAVLDAWVQRTLYVQHLAPDARIRSNTSLCLTVDGDAKAMAGLLEKEGVAFDIASYRDAPAGLRIWCGATVETSDLERLTHWLDWAHATLSA